MVELRWLEKESGEKVLQYRSRIPRWAGRELAEEDWQTVPTDNEKDHQFLLAQRNPVVTTA